MKRTYNVNDYYFTDSSNQSIYWAGFIAADGCLSKKDNSFSLSVAIKDIAHLEKFKENIRRNYKASELMKIFILHNNVWIELMFNLTKIEYIKYIQEYREHFKENLFK